MAGRPRKAIDDAQDESEAESEQIIEQKAKPVEYDPEKKIAIVKGGVTRIRREADLAPYLAAGWVRA